MTNEISFFKSFGREDFEKIINEIILRKLSCYSYQDRHINVGGHNKYTTVIHQNTRGE